ncbi:MAG: hypothetical protein LW817_07755, partial [Candidatus Caenarcaniphilales bacterium]|nr:hypothetical protein [Candidatus Caenarcaniphilales bacterium]
MPGAKTKWINVRSFGELLKTWPTNNTRVDSNSKNTPKEATTLINPQKPVNPDHTQNKIPDQLRALAKAISERTAEQKTQFEEDSFSAAAYIINQAKNYASNSTKRALINQSMTTIAQTLSHKI